VTRVFYKTFGCKANQYDTERMRQEVEVRGGITVDESEEFEVCLVNTCTVTNAADKEARKFIRKIRIIVAGCSAVLRGSEYKEMSEVETVVAGHDPVQVSLAAERKSELVQIRGFHEESKSSGIGENPSILSYRRSATRGWLKIQDGCDRKCSFCATRLARGASRSRSLEEIINEALILSQRHPEIVLTGIHIGHYGRDLECPMTLSQLLHHLLEMVPGTRFRLGSIEATEIDDSLLDLVNSSGGQIAPHFHMPLQSGSDPVLRRMRRWHSREKLPYLGLGADIITGFPGEQEKDHEETVRLVEELPYTYLHVFPFSEKDNTAAAQLSGRVSRKISRERGMQLRKIAEDKNMKYRSSRSGGLSFVALEQQGRNAITEDYLKVQVSDSELRDPERLYKGILGGSGRDLYIDLHS
jgi:threonylcarbamoyladenosine tRNA methylthiotransferase MtaB